MKKILSIILFALTLAACSRPPATPPATVTPVPLTATPSLTPTATSTETPTATITPLSTPLSVFAIPTYAYSNATITPLPTPDLPTYRLKPWTEAEAFELIRIADEFSVVADPYGPYDRHSYFDFFQQATNVTLDEALIRFPTTSNKNALLWHKAYTSAILGNTIGLNQWIAQAIEDWLNNEHMPINEINDKLSVVGFEASDEIEAENIFGDGRSSWLYTIHIANWGKSDGVIMVIRTLETGDYQVMPLDSKWSFSFGNISVASVGDENKNGIQQITVDRSSHNGSTCYHEIHVYEWKKDKFSDVTNGDIIVNDCQFEWSYQTNSGNGKSLLVAERRIGSFVGPTASQQTFAWNGKVYELVASSRLSPIDVWSNAKAVTLPAEETLLRQIALPSGYYDDYVRFRLGIVAALQAKRSIAVNELRKLVSSPNGDTKSIFPEMAAKFLESYNKDDVLLYKACIEANAFFGQYINSPYRSDGWYFLGDDEANKVFGIELHLYSSLFFIPICDPNRALDLLVSTFPVNTVSLAEIPNRLQNNQIYIRSYWQLDLNMDGENELLLEESDGQIMLVYKVDGVYRAKKVVKFDQEPVISVTALTVAETDTPMLVIQSDWNLEIYTVTPGFELENVLDEYSVSQYQIAAEDVPAIEVFYQPLHSTIEFRPGPWRGFRWNTERNTFTPDLIESMLFEDQKPKGVIELLKPVIPNFGIKDYEGPKLTYLLGLAYEMSGDEQNAVATYWNLWRKYPESPYAVMARYKLEAVNP